MINEPGNFLAHYDFLKETKIPLFIFIIIKLLILP